MNTHKEEKLGRVVVTQGEYKGLEGFACDYDPKKGTYNVDFNTGRTGPFHRIELAPLEPTPPSQIEEEPIYRLIMLWHDYNKHCYSGGTERSPVTFEEFITSSWLLNQLNNTK